jgi:hypothetical protein
MSTTKDTVTETIKATGKTLYNTVLKLIHEGNIRKITIKNRHGKRIADFPLTLGVIGATIAPIVAMIALIIGFANECSIEVEKEEQKSGDKK